MRIQTENKVSIILILMACASLVSMLATLNVDHIVNHDLYGYGLQFSTEWAVPYWTMAAVVFSMGWLIIVTSVVFELHSVVRRLKKHPEPKAEFPIVYGELVQNETSRIEAESSDESGEEEVKTTALAMKADDGLSEFRMLLEDVSVTTGARVTRQKAGDRQTNEK
jgi:hypothetical protein